MGLTIVYKSQFSSIQSVLICDNMFTAMINESFSRCNFFNVVWRIDTRLREPINFVITVAMAPWFIFKIQRLAISGLEDNIAEKYLWYTKVWYRKLSVLTLFQPCIIITFETLSRVEKCLQIKFGNRRLTSERPGNTERLFFFILVLTNCRPKYQVASNLRRYESHVISL